MKYLAAHRFKVIAMRDLARYVSPDVVPVDAWGVIDVRKRLLQKKHAPNNARKPTGEEDLHYWLENMVHHRFTRYEMAAALGQSADEVTIAFDVTLPER